MVNYNWLEKLEDWKNQLMLIEELVSVQGDYFLSLNAYSNEIFNLSRNEVKFEFD